MPIFDTHAHYDADRFDSDRDALLSAMPGVGVGLVLDPGCDLPSSRAAAELAERYPHVYAAVGIHPENFVWKLEQGCLLYTSDAADD